jgi:hypothetical protein
MSRPPAPPYSGEGPYALWHVSEDPGIDRFVPHVAPTSVVEEPRVWALDTRHVPLYWFPRDCPRCTFWASSATSEDDVARFLGGNRLLRRHVVEAAWLERVREATIYAYRLPDEPFEPDPDGTTGYWVAHAPVDPLEVVELRGLVALHESAGIGLNTVTNLWPLWDEVVVSTLDFSGMRLRNATSRPV